jgi:hypothetical protein
MGGHEAQSYWEHRGLARLWFAVLCGPAAWAVNQLVGYALVKPLCAAGSGVALTAVATGALVVTAAGAWVAWSELERLRDADPKGGRQEDRSQLMAIAGLALNLLLALLILTAAIPPFLLSPCE